MSEKRERERERDRQETNKQTTSTLGELAIALAFFYFSAKKGGKRAHPYNSTELPLSKVSLPTLFTPPPIMSAKRKPDKQASADDPLEDEAEEAPKGPFSRASDSVVAQRRFVHPFPCLISLSLFLSLSLLFLSVSLLLSCLARCGLVRARFSQWDAAGCA